VHKNTPKPAIDWPKYNKSLIDRGRLSMWISVDALANWQSAKKTGEGGHPREYPDAAIDCMLTFKEVYVSVYRQPKSSPTGAD
jgi:hypothetical protein